MIKPILTSLCLILPLLAMAEKEKLPFSLVPKGELPTTIAPHAKRTVSYVVTNTSGGILENIGVSFAPTGHTPIGVTQLSTVPNCTDPFTLKAGESCTLLLMVVADDLADGTAKGGPEVCNSSPMPIRCGIPAPEHELNIHVSSMKSSTSNESEPSDPSVTD